MKTLSGALGRLFAPAGSTPATVEQRRRNARAWAKARRLAAKHGIGITRDSAGGYWVTHGVADAAANGGPLDGNHFCEGGEEVLAACESYRDHLTKSTT